MKNVKNPPSKELIGQIINLINDLPILVIDKKKQIIASNESFSVLLQKTNISKNLTLNQKIEIFINKPENFVDTINTPLTQDLLNNLKVHNLISLLKNIRYKITHFTSFDIFLSILDSDSSPALTNVFIFRLFPFDVEKNKISKTKEFFLVVFVVDKEKFLSSSREELYDEINKKYIFLLQVANRVFSTVKGFTETLIIGQYKDIDLIYNFIKTIDNEVSQGIKILLSFNLSDTLAQFDIQKINLYEFLLKITDKMYSRILNDFPSIKFSYYIQPNIPEIYTDPHKLELCMYNLFDNSLRFRDESKEENLIKFEAFFDSSANKIFLIFWDNGIGMDKSEISKLGNLFQTFSDKSGIGLGMYIVHKIVKNLEWEINIESEKFKYTKVTLAIPLK
ncbi:MAG: sensor histidine kinase [bacterium]